MPSKSRARKSFILAMLAILVLALAGSASAQKKDDRCEEGNNYPRNWDLMERAYVYFFYTLCPPDLVPAKPLVKVLIQTGGKDIYLEKWTKDREGADTVTVFVDNKKAYTLYRDLKAIPFQYLKQERRSSVPAEIAAQPFMLEGAVLVLFQNLNPDSADRAKNVFENADLLIKKAEKKTALLYDSPRIIAIVVALENPPKQK